MKRLFFSVLLVGLMILTGCTTQVIDEKIDIEPRLVGKFEAEDFLFDKGSGRATIVNNDYYLDVIVLAKNLNPENKYSITILNSPAGGVMFGPRANVELRFGRLVEETFFYPNEQGDLYVSMVHPERIFSSAQEIRVEVKSEDGSEVRTSASFRIN